MLIKENGACDAGAVKCRYLFERFLMGLARAAEDDAAAGDPRDVKARVVRVEPPPIIVVAQAEHVRAAVRAEIGSIMIQRRSPTG